MGKTFSAHDAVADVSALQELVNKKKLDPLPSAVTSASAVEHVQFCADRNVRWPTLSILVQKKVISSGMADKIAGSGLAYAHLALAYRRDREHGLRLLLSEKVTSNGGKPQSTDFELYTNLL